MQIKEMTIDNMKLSDLFEFVICKYECNPRYDKYLESDSIQIKTKTGLVELHFSHMWDGQRAVFADYSDKRNYGSGRGCTSMEELTDFLEKYLSHKKDEQLRLF